jgi:iron complex transport system permease protein
VGGAVTLLLVCAIANDGQFLAPTSLLLTGIAVSAGMGAASLVIAMHIDLQVYAYAISWMAGSLTKGDWNYVSALAAWLAATLPIAWLVAASLNVMQLGDEASIGLGVPVRRRRLALLTLAVAISGACMALVGGIVFLGLLGPHIARRLIGPNNRLLIPAAAVIGAGLLLLADTISRTAFSPLEIPAGVTVNAFGSPYFLYLLMRS